MHLRPAAIVCAVALVFLSGCQDDNHRLEALEAGQSSAATMQRELKALRAELAALPPGVDLAPLEQRVGKLEQLVGSLPAPVDLSPLQERVNKLEQGAAVKVPHLIVDKTGEDLGQIIGGGDLVWSPKLGGELMPTALMNVMWDQPSCTGAPFLQAQHSKQLVNTATGHIFKGKGPAQPINIASYSAAGGNCVETVDSSTGVPAMDTGLANVLYDSAELRIELR